MPCYEEGLVVFVDIQGMRALTEFDKKLDLHQTFHDQAARTEAREELMPTRTLKRRVLSFSDCAYFVYTWNERASEERKSSPLPLLEALPTMLILVQILMNKGYWIRGGATYGEVFLDQYGAFGPAIEKAYEIESSKAFYPRIMLEGELGERLYTFQNEQRSRMPDVVKNSLAKQVVINKDEHSYYVNSFAGLDAYGIIEGETLEWGSFFPVALKKCESVASQRICNKDGTLDEKKTSELYRKSEWLKEELYSEDNLIKGLVEPEDDFLNKLNLLAGLAGTTTDPKEIALLTAMGIDVAAMQANKNGASGE